MRRGTKRYEELRRITKRYEEIRRDTKVLKSTVAGRRCVCAVLCCSSHLSVFCLSSYCPSSSAACSPGRWAPWPSPESGSACAGACSSAPDRLGSCGAQTLHENDAPPVAKSAGLNQEQNNEHPHTTVCATKLACPAGLGGGSANTLPRSK